MAKKKGKKGGKKGKKKGKKSAEPEMTFKEAILAYQIGIKEKQIEEYQYEVRGLEERNKRHRDRNERLKSEQHYYIQHLLKQAKEWDKVLENEEAVDKEQVITVMRDKWATEKNEKQSLIDMNTDLLGMDGRIYNEEREVSKWEEYKDRGQHEHRTQVQLLQQELDDMQHAFDEMAAYLTRTLEKTKVDIEEETEQTLDRQKFIASEKAMANMDKTSKQEVMDNDWLKKETEIHTREYENLLGQVEELEKQNLEIMSELFDCKVDDLKISRNFFLTQFQDDDNLEQEPGILEIDLSRLSLEDGAPKALTNKTGRPTRPKSATQRAVEKKVFSLTGVDRVEEEDEDEEEEEEESGEEGEEEDLSGAEDFENYFNFDDEDFNTYLQLGPLELKLLNVQGQRMSLHTPIRPPTAEQQLKTCNPDKWPITHPMLDKVLNPPPPREILYQ